MTIMLDAKRKAMIFLALAFILAILAATLLLNEIRNAQASLGETIQVAVAKEDIQTYTPLDESMITWENIPASTEISSYVQDEQELVSTVSIVPVKKGDLITKNILRSTVDVPEDHRIVWLNATENVVMDQTVVEGDQVDIIVSYQSKRSETRTVRMFDGVDVVQRVEPEEDEDDKEASIKVSLPIEEAEELIHFQNTANQIRVLLANQAEVEVTKDKEETKEEKDSSKKNADEENKEEKSSRDDDKEDRDEEEKNSKKDERNDDDKEDE